MAVLRYLGQDFGLLLGGEVDFGELARGHRFVLGRSLTYRCISRLIIIIIVFISVILEILENVDSALNFTIACRRFQCLCLALLFISRSEINTRLVFVLNVLGHWMLGRYNRL